MGSALFNLFALMFIYMNGSWVFSLKNKILQTKSVYNGEVQSVSEAISVLSEFVFEIGSILFTFIGLFTFQSNIFLAYILITYYSYYSLRNMNRAARKIPGILDSKKYVYTHYAHSFIGLMFGLFAAFNYNYHLKTGVDLLSNIFNK